MTQSKPHLGVLIFSILFVAPAIILLLFELYQMALTGQVDVAKLGTTLFMTVLFGSISVGIVFLTKKDQPNTDPQVQAQPWLVKPEWAQNSIRPDGQRVPYITFFFALLWNAMSWPALLSNMYKLKGDEAWMAVGLLLFPLVGLGLIIWFIRSWLQWRRFGGISLVLNPFPGAIGGQVGGTIQIPYPLASQVSYRVILSCVKRDYYVNSDNPWSNKLIWQRRVTTQRVQTETEDKVMFRVDVPADIPATDLNRTKNIHHWQLQLLSSDGRIDQLFEIPVFQTAASSTLDLPQAEPEQQLENKQNLASYLPFQINRGTGGVRVHYPIFYRPANKLIVLFALFSVLGIPYFLGLEQSDFAWLVNLFVSLGGIVSLWVLSQLFASLTVKVNRQQRTLSSTRTWFGFLKRTQQASFTEITDIVLKPMGQKQNSAGEYTQYYEVRAHTPDQRQLLLAKQVAGEQIALLIKAFFEDILAQQQPEN